MSKTFFKVQRKHKIPVSKNIPKTVKAFNANVDKFDLRIYLLVANVGWLRIIVKIHEKKGRSRAESD